MERIRDIVTKKPLTTFVIVTYILSWWSIPFANGGIFPYGPFAGALIVVAIERSRGGIRGFLRYLFSWRGGWYWLLIGPALIMAYQGAAFLLNLALGARSVGSPLQSFAFPILSLILLGGQWEEPGWTGYALPLLQDRYANRPRGLLLASLHLGLIRAAWHIPLIISGAQSWVEVVIFIMAFQFLVSWIYNRSSGNVLAVMFFHFASNIGGLTVLFFNGIDRDQYRFFFSLFAWLIALPVASWKAWSMGRLNTTDEAA